MQNYKNILIILGLATLLLIGNHHQVSLLYFSYNHLESAQQEQCPVPLPISYTTSAGLQNYVSTQSSIQSIHANTLKIEIENGGTVETYESSTVSMMFPGVILFVLALLVYIFQCIVFLTKKNRLCRRNIEINKIKKHELVINYCNLVITGVLALGGSILIMTDLHSQKAMITSVQCSYDALYNEYFNGNSSQKDYIAPGQTTYSWKGQLELDSRLEFVEKKLLAELQRINKVTIDQADYESKSQALLNDLDALYTKFKDSTMASPDRSSASGAQVQSLFLSQGFGPTTQPGTSLHNIQQSMSIQQSTVTHRKTLMDSSQKELDLLSTGEGVNVFFKNIESISESVYQKQIEYEQAVKNYGILWPVFMVVLYMLAVLSVMSVLVAMVISKNMYSNYRLKFLKRLTLIWNVGLFISMTIGIMLAFLLPVVLQISDHCGVHDLQIDSSSFQKYNMIFPQASSQLSQCLYGDGQVYSLVPGYADIDTIQIVMALQMAQVNQSTSGSSSFRDVYQLRSHISSEVTNIQDIKAQRKSDSSLSTEQNHLLALEALSKFSDYSINKYISCQLSRDRFIFSQGDCPSDYANYVSESSSPVGQDKKYCIRPYQITLTTLKARYEALRDDKMKTCDWQIDEVATNFEKVLAHYQSRLTLFTNIETDYQALVTKAIQIEPLLIQEQKDTLSSYHADQAIIDNYLKANKIEFDCRFLRAHRQRIASSFCHVLLPSLFGVALKMVLWCITLVLMSNRLFCYINFQKLMFKQEKLFAGVKAKTEQVGESQVNLLNDLIGKEESPAKPSRIDQLVDAAMSSEEDIVLPTTKYNQALVNEALREENKVGDDD